MKIGLYFGSFNPVHAGHLIIASHILNETDIEKVWLVVSPQNPFKQENGLLNEYHRLHLVQLATEQDNSIIMGSDSFQNLHKWKNAELIIRDYEIYVYPRPGFPADNTINARMKMIDAPLLQLSATHIRKCIADGKSIRYMVPDIVLEEIEKGGYYKK